MDSYIGLLTDFGMRGSHYVASMKGVITKVNPRAIIIDISHSVKSYSIVEASYLLMSTYKYFPEGTVFIVVIDPGVGSGRDIVAIRTDEPYYFVGPDNGIFSRALESNITDCFVIDNEDYYHKPVSNTFHGRDIMGPIGASIALGVSLDKIGHRIDHDQLKTHPISYELDEMERKCTCTIQYVDNFGNLTTNIKLKGHQILGSEIHLFKRQELTISANNRLFRGLFVSHFGTVPEKSLVFTEGSTSFLEISINQGNASEELNISTGDVVQINL